MKMLSLISILTTTLVSFSTVHAADKIKMNFKNEELTKVIEQYSKASGQKFIVDATVRGNISIFNPGEVTQEEAFNQLSTALAVNGYAISKQGDTMVVRSARNVQRDLIEVGTEVPALKPERMYSWIYSPKNLSVEDISRDLRLLTSKDGELSPSSRTNQIVITDWVSNIHRVAATLSKIDIKVDASTAKIVEAADKRTQERLLRRAKTESSKNE